MMRRHCDNHDACEDGDKSKDPPFGLLKGWSLRDYSSRQGIRFPSPCNHGGCQ